MRAKHLITIIAAVALSAGLLAACGGDDDEGGGDAPSGAEEIATEWLAAMQAEDYPAACGFMDQEGFTDKAQCELAMKALSPDVSEESEIGAVAEVEGGSEVEVLGPRNAGFTLFMTELDGEWLISAIDAS